jgi:hypothetical protein
VNIGGPVEEQGPPVRPSEPVVAALDPVTGQLMWEAWTSDGSISLAFVTR